MHAQVRPCSPAQRATSAAVCVLQHVIQWLRGRNKHRLEFRTLIICACAGQTMQPSTQAVAGTSRAAIDTLYVRLAQESLSQPGSKLCSFYLKLLALCARGMAARHASHAGTQAAERRRGGLCHVSASRAAVHEGLGPPCSCWHITMRTRSGKVPRKLRTNAGIRTSVEG